MFFLYYYYYFLSLSLSLSLSLPLFTSILEQVSLVPNGVQCYVSVTLCRMKLTRNEHIYIYIYTHTYIPAYAKRDVVLDLPMCFILSCHCAEWKPADDRLRSCHKDKHRNQLGAPGPAPPHWAKLPDMNKVSTRPARVSQLPQSSVLAVPQCLQSHGSPTHSQVSW